MTKQDTASPGRRLRDLLAAPGILVCPGIYDGFSARLVEQAGFKTAAISGAGVSESNLGWADVGIMGYEENVSRLRAPWSPAPPSRCRPTATPATATP